MRKLVSAWRKFEDCFVCTPTEERFEVCHYGPEYYEEARIKFRKMLFFWAALILFSSLFRWWVGTLILSNCCILHLSFFMLAQSKSSSGVPFLEHTDAVSIIFVPLLYAALFNIVVFTVWGLIV